MTGFGVQVGTPLAPHDSREGIPMKRLLLLASLALLATPGLAVARDQNGDDQGEDQKEHQHVTAKEMAGVGIGAAALIGVAGYLALRRRRA